MENIGQKYFKKLDKNILKNLTKNQTKIGQKSKKQAYMAFKLCLNITALVYLLKPL